MTDGPFRILGIAGSLRRGSFNRGLLRAATEVAPDGVELETFELGSIPLYNEDVRVAGEPAAVGELKERIRAADGLLIATPEYNYSVPGVLKNAIDWASRPPEETPLRHKPIGLMGAGGTYGTARSQLALRQVFLFTRSYVLPEPELYVVNAREKFDQDGNLQDEPTRQLVPRGP